MYSHHHSSPCRIVASHCWTNCCDLPQMFTAVRRENFTRSCFIMQIYSDVLITHYAENGGHHVWICGIGWDILYDYIYASEIKWLSLKSTFINKTCFVLIVCVFNNCVFNYWGVFAVCRAGGGSWTAAKGKRRYQLSAELHFLQWRIYRKQVRAAGNHTHAQFSYSWQINTLMMFSFPGVSAICYCL